MIASMVVLWPIWFIGLAIAAVCAAVKKFLTWDVKLWQASRKTKRIEEDLERPRE